MAKLHMGGCVSNIRTSVHFRKHPLAFAGLCWPLLAFTWCLGCLKRPPDKVFRAFTKFCKCLFFCKCSKILIQWESSCTYKMQVQQDFACLQNLPAPTFCRCRKIFLQVQQYFNRVGILLHLHKFLQVPTHVGAARAAMFEHF